jgi:hypothetical protein
MGYIFLKFDPASSPFLVTSCGHLSDQCHLLFIRRRAEVSRKTMSAFTLDKALSGLEICVERPATRHIVSSPESEEEKQIR